MHDHISESGPSNAINGRATLEDRRSVKKGMAWSVITHGRIEWHEQVPSAYAK
jgi:hypothetical protein